MAFKVFLCLFTFFLLVKPAYAATPSENKTISDTVILQAPTVWVLHNLTFAKNATLITNGNSLIITVIGDLRSDEGAKIISFADTSAPPQPPAAPNGVNGQSFNPGPGTEGSGAPGPRGGAGGNGSAGARGVDGKSPGPITIVVIGNMYGPLKILNRGGDGGQGGLGGNGGNGGNGGQGQRAQPNLVGFGIAIGCKNGPGDGGDGGTAGNGGNGGQGGDGGNGGLVYLEIRGDASKADVYFSAAPGHPGPGGGAGGPGQPGQGGFGGRGAQGCEGREIERQGRPGSAGSAGNQGELGSAGSKGKTEIVGNFHNQQEI